MLFIEVNADFVVNADCIEYAQWNELQMACEIYLRRQNSPGPGPDYPPAIAVKMTRAEFDDIVLQLRELRDGR